MCLKTVNDDEVASDDGRLFQRAAILRVEDLLTYAVRARLTTVLLPPPVELLKFIIIFNFLTSVSTK